MSSSRVPENHGRAHAFGYVQRCEEVEADQEEIKTSVITDPTIDIRMETESVIASRSINHESDLICLFDRFWTEIYQGNFFMLYDGCLLCLVIILIFIPVV